LLGAELRQYRGGTETLRLPVPEFHGEVSSLMEDSRGQVWIGTVGTGLWQVSSNRQVRHWSPSNGFPDKIARVVFEDRDLNVWAGTERGGLTRFKERTFHSPLTVTNRLAFARFALASPATGGMLVASFKQGLWRADAGGLTKLDLPEPFHNGSVSALSLLADRTGRLWIGALSNGVWSVEGTNARWMPIDASGQAPVRSLFEDSRGRIWLTGGESVSVFESGTMRVFGPAQGLPAGGAYALAEDQAGAIWLAQDRGVFRFNSDRWVEIFDPLGRSLRMSALLADAEGAMWMASINTGLFRWHEGRLLHQPLPPELPMRGVFTIREDHLGWFWMTSNQGVLRAHKNEVQSWLEGRQPAVAWQVFGVSDGLPSAECGDSARDERGRLWFASSRGVAWVDPSAPRPPPTAPPVLIQELTYHRAAPRVYGGEAAGAKAPPVRSMVLSPFPATLTLPPGSRRLEVHYTALDFTAPEELRFQIKLEPGDGDWQDVGSQRIAQYYDFHPGDYVFRVRAVCQARVWDETEASLAFVVQPFVWQTVWFRAGLALLLVGSGGGAVGLWARARLRRAAERDKTADEMRDLAGRLITAQEEERTRLARELHDDLSQSLALLSVDLELFGQKPPSAPGQINTRMQELSSQVKELSSEVHRLSHELHPAKLEQLGLVAAVRGFCMELSTAHEMAIEFEPPALPRVLPKNVALCLYRITQEALQNVVKHSGATGAKVELMADEREIRLVVTDDGQGFDADLMQGGGSLGLVSMRERVRMVQGQLAVNSCPGEGTRIEVRVPIGAMADGAES
jgi:signal transduction histidine kinase/ligand-binding sensor domain-containing protein